MSLNDGIIADVTTGHIADHEELHDKLRFLFDNVVTKSIPFYESGTTDFRYSTNLAFDSANNELELGSATKLLFGGDTQLSRSGVSALTTPGDVSVGGDLVVTGSLTANIDLGDTITVDTINESTAGVGVTVDGTLVKDSGITASGLATFSNATGVTTNTITERTSASGVTADGVLLKDSGVTASGTSVFSGSTTVSHASGVITNTITERTAASGVTIDGVLLKDSGATFDGAVTLSDVDVVLGTGTGTKIGTATTQKLGFYNATPIVRPAGTADVLASLVSLGLRAASSNPPLNLGTGAITAGAITASGTATFSAAAGVTTNTVTERTAASGVTIDGLVVKDGGFAIPYGRVYRSAAHTNLTSGTWLLATWDAQEYDPDGAWPGATNPRVRPTQAGVYEFTAQVRFDANATGSRGLDMRLNSGGTETGGTRIAYRLEDAAPTAGHSMQVSGLWEFNGSTDYVEVHMYQDSGGPLAPDEGPGDMWISWRFISNV